MKQRGFILPSPMILYGAIAAAAIIALLGVALWVQTGRVEVWKGKHDTLVTQVKTLGDAAIETKKLTEQNHEKVLTDVSRAWQGSLDAAVTGAVARYRMRNANPGGGTLRGITLDPKASDGASSERLACAPDKPFIEACAADATKIGSFQSWARGIGFKLK